MTRLYSPILLLILLSLSLCANAIAISLQFTPVERERLITNKQEKLVALGLKYENGDGVAKDYTLARQYYEQAIEWGSVQAFHNLGSLYNWGYGVDKNRQMALLLWEQGASKGNMYSSFNMGNAFLIGNGVSQDTYKALDYYMASYNQGYKPAICKYGDTLLMVEPSDIATTISLLKPVAQKGESLCLSAIVGLLHNNYDLHKDGEALLRWALKGDAQNLPDVVFTLGIIYDFGERGIKADADKAKAYYTKAAELGRVNALANLGFMYESGKFGNPDTVTAKYYYEQAIEAGSAWGYNNLATFYRDGTGKVVDYEKALSLYKKSAEMGNAYAYRNMGNMLRFGEGVEKNAYEAEAHLTKSIELGYTQSLVDLGFLYLDESLPLFNKSAALEQFYKAVDNNVPGALESVAQQFKEEDREWFVLTEVASQLAYDLAGYFEKSENKFEACKWYLVAFKRRHDDAYLDVMKCVNSKQYPDAPYASFKDVAIEWAEYMQWDAYSLIGELYYYGISTTKDKHVAAEYFLRSHRDSGDEIAQYKLGEMYLIGEGVQKDYDAALRFLMLASEAGVSAADVTLSKMYRNGNGVASNKHTAFNFMKNAAEYLDDSEATFLYAQMLYEGYAAPRDIDLAIDWFDRAIQLGSAEAPCFLGSVLTQYGKSDEDRRRAAQLSQGCN
ncbi:tetratricopeptide repeat protein [Alteromonas sp. A079]|uniref:tetratricopeptide repeat protein n=1 Tax=Alteromonas sp. A079 TaxID=3410268 RepID=UPI003B9E5693